VFVYKRRIVLGGAASAAALTLGIFAAGPAMAGTTTSGVTKAPTALVSSVVPGPLLGAVFGATGVPAGLQGLSGKLPVVSQLPLAAAEHPVTSGGAVTGTAPKSGAGLSSTLGSAASAVNSLPAVGSVSKALGTGAATRGLVDGLGEASGLLGSIDGLLGSSSLG
jgi:hypothetical protein